MPIYSLYCEICSKKLELICSYNEAKEYRCPLCNEIMTIVPSKTSFNIEGYSYSNGYNGADCSYDGNSKTWD